MAPRVDAMTEGIRSVVTVHKSDVKELHDFLVRGFIYVLCVLFSIFAILFLIAMELDRIAK